MRYTANPNVQYSKYERFLVNRLNDRVGSDRTGLRPVWIVNGYFSKQTGHGPFIIVREHPVCIPIKPVVNCSESFIVDRFNDCITGHRQLKPFKPDIPKNRSSFL